MKRDWLQAIEDCGILRVSFDDDELIALIDDQIVDARPVEGNDDALDYRLTTSLPVCRALVRRA